MTGTRRKKGAGPSAWEWAVAALGCVVLVATLAFLVHDATTPDTPPDPVISVVAMQPLGSRHVVRLRVDNRGRETAARLRIHATLSGNGAVLEEAETEFDYVPGRSSREAGLFFRHDPSAYALEIVPRSYQRP